MAFAKKSTNKEDVKAQASNYINASGIYPLAIIAGFVSTSASGSSAVDFYVDNEGQKQVLYGNMRVYNKPDKDGNEVENKIGMKLLNHLMVIADVDLDDPVDGELPIGKEGADKTVAILEELSDIDILMRIQMEYSKHNGNIQEKKVIREFYRATDGATAEEIVNDTEAGVGLEKDQKYKDNITYKDDLTAEDIAAWVAGGRKNGSGGGSTAKAAKPSFGNKRFGSKK